MNITFMIGNGFDLNCGVKCRFIDAYNGYCKTPSEKHVIENFKHAINESIEDWGDFEVAMAKRFSEFNSEEDFISCLRDFKKYLVDYLEKEEKSFKASYMNNEFIKNMIRKEVQHSIDSFYQDVTNDLTYQIERQSELQGVVYKVINYNYTTIFDDLFSLVYGNGSKDNIVHIHGRYSDAILGMDNIDQFNNIINGRPISASGKRAFIKPYFNNQFDNRRVNIAMNNIDNSDVICSFGMSWGISDLTWRHKIIEWIKADENRQLFVYRYQESIRPYSTIDERLDREELAKYKLFNDFGIEENEYSDYINRVHIPCGKNIFDIQNTISRGLDEYKKISEQKERINKSMNERPRENGLGR